MIVYFTDYDVLMEARGETGELRKYIGNDLWEQVEIPDIHHISIDYKDNSIAIIEFIDGTIWQVCNVIKVVYRVDD